MARDHYIPAVLLGQFSSIQTGRARERNLWVASRNDVQPRRRKAESIGHARDLYTVAPYHQEGDPREVDDTWGRYERSIPDALTDLHKSGEWGLIDTWRWMHVLVPLVAGLYVRGVDFAHGKQVSHVNDEGKLVRPDPRSNVNFARVPEQTRLLAPLMAARWELHTFPSARLITSERGFTLVKETQDAEPSGVVVPIRLEAALVIKRRSVGTVAVAENGRWRTPIFRVLHDPADADGLNRSMARSAKDFIAGSSRSLIEGLSSELRQPYKPEGRSLHLMWGTDDELALNQLEWWNFRALMTHEPDDSIRDRFGLFTAAEDWEPPADEWMPTMFFTPGRPHQVTALSKVGGIVQLHLDYPFTIRETIRDLRDPLTFLGREQPI